MKLFQAVALVAAMSSTALSAATFDFSFTSTEISGAGVFTATDLLDGSFQVTQVSGTTTIGGVTQTILGLGGIAGDPDNLLFPNQAPPFSFQGVTYLLADLSQVNLFDSADFAGLSRAFVFRNGEAFFFPTNGGFAVTLTNTTAVPEPAGWAMMIGGFALVGGAMRRRQTATVTFA